VIPLHRIVHILLLLCLPLYGFAMQGGVSSVGNPVSLVHELEHDQGVAHHHHEDDGSVHYDESDESLEHAQEHSSPAQPAGLSLPRLIVPPEQLVSALGSHVFHPVPEPFLDGPLRPPSSTLGQAAGGTLHT